VAGVTNMTAYLILAKWTVKLQKKIILVITIFFIFLTNSAHAEFTFSTISVNAKPNEGWINFKVLFKGIKTDVPSDEDIDFVLNFAANIEKGSFIELDYSNSFDVPYESEFKKTEMFIDKSKDQVNSSMRRFYNQLSALKQSVFEGVCDYLQNDKNIKKVLSNSSASQDVKTFLKISNLKEDIKTLSKKCVKTLSRVYVEDLQIYLDLLGYSVGSIDGLWGSKTEKAVKLYLEDSDKSYQTMIDSSLLRELRLKIGESAPKLSVWGSHSQYFDDDGKLINRVPNYTNFKTLFYSNFSEPVDLKNFFFHDKIYQKKLELNFKQNDGFGRIQCCNGPKFSWDVENNTDRVELEYQFNPLTGKHFRTEFMFKTPKATTFSHRVLISQFKHHSKPVNGKNPKSAPSVAIYADNGGEVSCVEFTEFDEVDYTVNKIHLRDGYLTDGSWHKVVMEWRPSKNGENGICLVSVDDQVQILQEGVRNLNFSDKNSASIRIGPYRDNVDYNQTFYFDDWKIESRQP
tara:strand:+ start:2683 stop:4230 length:1548 start_codon:yes stop_codon:yes gene_type:complete